MRIVSIISDFVRLSNRDTLTIVWEQEILIGRRIGYDVSSSSDVYYYNCFQGLSMRRVDAHQKLS